MPSGEREPLQQQTGAREVYIPSPTGPENVIEITVAIDNELVNPENLSPCSIYSLVIARNEGCFVENPGWVSPYNLKEGFELGLHAMMRSKHYTQEEHGQLRADLFQGYLQQIRILQEQSLQKQPPDIQQPQKQ